MVRREGFEPPTLRFEERIAPQQKQEVTLSGWQVAAQTGILNVTDRTNVTRRHQMQAASA